MVANPPQYFAGSIQYCTEIIHASLGGAGGGGGGSGGGGDGGGIDGGGGVEVMVLEEVVV